MRSESGFTLIELMVVVAIIGILSVLAIPNYLNFAMKAKAAEVKLTLSAVIQAEHNYFSEFDVFVATPKNPATIPPPSGIPWIMGMPQWEKLLQDFDGKMRYQYQVQAPAEAGDPYLAVAVGDLDGDSVYSIYQWDTRGNQVVLSPLE